MSGSSFTQLVDIDQIRRLLESQFKITGILAAILDTEENILVSVGWKDICTRFHRAHPATSARCRQSDAYIKSHLKNHPDQYLDYRCKNGLREVALPIIIGDEHVATFFTGQFFYEDDKPDRDFFLLQAREFGFDEQGYLAAYDQVPVCSREQIRNIMDYYRNLVQVMAEMGMRNLRLSREVAERKEAERALRRETAERLRTADELREKERLLVLQSRQAALGAMIGNIAHQWRQPINTLGLLLQDLVMTFDDGEFNREYLNGTVDRALEQIRHMSQTIDDFRNFYRPDKQKAPFKARAVIIRALSLIERSLKGFNITVEMDQTSDAVVIGYQNEYTQVLLNILLNARDAFSLREVDQPKITIGIGMENEKSVVTIADNAGGIPDEFLDRVFDLNFTTKETGKGSGIGLYMSKTIIERNMNGVLSVRNRGEGAEFRIEV